MNQEVHNELNNEINPKLFYMDLARQTALISLIKEAVLEISLSEVLIDRLENDKTDEDNICSDIKKLFERKDSCSKLIKENH